MLADNIHKLLGIDTLKPLAERILGTYQDPQLTYNRDESQGAKIEDIKKRLAINETASVKGDRYGFHKFSGVKEYGDDLGYYQIIEAQLREHGKKYLGQIPTKEQFLKSAKMQEQYMTARVKDLLDRGFTPEQIADIHRSGSTLSDPGSTEPQYRSPKYVEKFTSHTL